MSKFYVTSGSRRLVISASTARQAAQSMLDDVLSAHAWIYDDAGLTDRCRHDHLALETLVELGSEICVSERGFGRSEAGRFGVPELLDRWHATMTTLSRLLASAGLTPPGSRS